MAMELPEHLRGRTNRKINKELVVGLGSTRQPYLSIMGNRLHLVDSSGEQIPVETFDAKTGVYLDCCIIDTNPGPSRIYYGTAFNASQDSYRPPDCWSDNQVAPSIHANNPQSDTCVTCKHAVWGSSTSALGKPVPACSTYKKLALLVPQYEKIAFMLRVPPGSLKNFYGYVEKFLTQNVDVADVMTRISFLPGAVGILSFQALTYIDTPLADARDALQASGQTDLIVGRNDQPRPLALGAPVAQPAIAAPVTARPTQPDPSDTPSLTQPDTPPPRAKRGRPAKAVAGPEKGALAPFETAPAGPAPAETQFGIGQAPPPSGELGSSLNNFFDS